MKLALCLGLGSGNGASSEARWTPTDLGASLLGYWDAERADKVALSGSSVTGWTDLVGSYAAVQATGASQPQYSATSFNGRPGITFDGTDDQLRLPSQPFPSGATPSEIWVLASQDAPSVDAGTRRAFAYGGITNNDTRYMTRTQSGGVGVLSVQTGTGAVNAASATGVGVPYEGRHVARGIYGATTVQAMLDSVMASAQPAVSATATTETRIGVGTNGAGFWLGVISAVIVTSALTDPEAARLNAYLKARGSIA